ncbi:efflux RND transporter periplasmic adaptor subunit [Lacticigenium naphthae]|uniref:efflux RND transporter periplasmic adaptor subunit n=1 Tax=Lacticigenium naphthae TaxID=515351 RepID=UPI00040F7979|nr:HlyD family efflux transporter periplasmic adaptor subunit [Lacticigenium naphthae]
MKKWIGILVALAVVGFIGYNIWAGGTTDETPTVRTAPIERGSISEMVSATGTIEPSEKQEIVGQGLVSELPVEVGDTVEEGDLLVSYMDGTTHEAAFAGTIVELNITEETIDSSAQKGTPSLVLSNLEDLEVALSLSKSDSALVKEGQEVALTYGNSEYTGTVDFVAPVATQTQSQLGTSSTLATRIVFDETPEEIVAGFDIDVDILVNSAEDVLILPIEALLYDDENRPYAFVVENETAKKVELSIGIQSPSGIEIVDGLEENDEVILSPTESIEDGSAVITE